MLVIRSILRSLNGLSALVLFASLCGSVIAQTPAAVASSSAADTIVNWAAAGNGGVASVSTTLSAKNYPAASLNDGDRTGDTWGNGGGWQGKGTGKTADWAQIMFSASQTIDSVTVYSLQDATTQGVDPPESLTFSQYGLVAFDVQIKSGAAWTTVASVTGNNLVKRTVPLTPVKTTGIRILCNAGVSGAAASLVEIEAWGAVGIGNVALPSHGAVAITASSTLSSTYPPTALNDGVTSGADWGGAPDGGWSSAASGFPAWAQVSFMQAQVVHAVTLWTLQDAYQSAAPPGLSTTFSTSGLTAFDVQSWDGSNWTTVASVTGNNLVERTVTFPPISTLMLRAVCNAGLQNFAPIVELQAWGITAPPPPILSGLSALNGAAGGSLTVVGQNFSVIPTANIVTFNDVAAAVTSATSTSLTVTIPAGATPGPIAVTVNAQTTTSTVNFTPGTVTALAAQTGPTITGFTPASGIAGSTITITGTGFSTTPRNNSVAFPGNVAASVTAATATSLTVIVPSGGIPFGAIKVTVGGVTATSSGSFTILANITSFTPASGPIGTTVTINGTSFGGATSAGTVWFNGTSAGVSSWSDTQILAVLPAGASTGAITVSTYRNVSTATSATNFTVTSPAPTITSFTPTTAAAGAAVTITGTNFSPTASADIVAFNGTNAAVTAASTTSITATVPVGATTGPITVTLGGQTGTSPSSFTVTAPLPTITAVTPTSAPLGSTITLTGTNFSTTASQDSVSVGGVEVPVNATPTATSLTITLPTHGITLGATTIQLGTPAGASNIGNFTVTRPPPTISSFTPVIGPAGTVVTITGTNFDATAASNNTVSFNGASVAASSATTTALTASVPSSATTGPISVTVAGQTGTSASSYTVGVPAPTITSISPSSGPIGTSVTVAGTSFGANMGVGNILLNGVQANVSSWSDTAIVFTVGTSSTTGVITITASSRLTVTSIGSFIVGPSITSLSTSSGYVGSSVTLTGLNFSSTASANSVAFGGVAASITSASTTTLIVTVPPGAASGPITVTTNGYTATSSPFTVTLPPPTIASFSPTQGPAGTTVTITGTNFVANTSGNTVTFNGQSATVTAATATTITTAVPAGSTSGPITVTTAYGTVSSSTPFALPPTISSFSPGSGTLGSSITIRGQNFGATAAANTVTIGGVAATVTAASTTSLTVTVPTGAVTGPVVVTVGSQSVTGGTFTVLLSVSGFTPFGGPVGTTVTINGSGFSTTLANNAVTFNGTAATVTTATTKALTVTVPAGATTGFVSVVVVGQTATSTGYFDLPPTITAVNPTAGGVGASVIITGTNFDPIALSDTVKFGGATASIASVSTTSMTVQVPAAAVSGPVTVSNAAGSVTGPAFTVLPTPTITSFSPTNGPAAISVTLTGTNFSPTAAANTVAFNGVTAPVTAASATSLTVTVPALATTGPISVTVAGVTGYSTTPFTAAPVIQSFTPGSGGVGSSVRLNGLNFSSTPTSNIVQFVGASNNAAVSSASTTSLLVTVPTGVQTGLIGVTVAGQIGLSPSSFTVLPPPSISDFNPKTGPAGTTVTISGQNFGSTVATNSVQFNGVPATVLSANPSLLTVSVPSGISTGPISVTVGSQVATSYNVFTVAQSPTITSFSPIGGQAGDTVTITGTNFSPTAANNAIQINGVSVSPQNITAPNTTTLTAVIPAGATTGPISVTVGGLTATSQASYLVLTASGFPSTAPCSAPQPPINPGSDPARPGLWADPNRGGAAWSFNFNTINGFAVTWYTFDAAGNPIWLSNQGASLQNPSATNEYLVPLYRSTMSSSGVASIPQAAEAYVAIAFVPGSSTNAAITWKWSLVDNNAQQPAECVYNYFNSNSTSSNQAALVQVAGTALDESYTGIWTSTPGGWGVSTTVATCPSGSSVCSTGTTYEADLFDIYDTAGQPVWLTGLAVSPTTASTAIPLVYGKSNYTSLNADGTGYPTATCTSGCTTNYYAGATAPNVPNNTGTFTRTFASNSSETPVNLVVSVTSTASRGVAAPVTWPYYSPFQNPTSLSKSLTENPLVTVNQNYCASACTIAVGWTDGTAGDALYRRDLTTNTLSTVALQAGANGICSDSSQATAPYTGGSSGSCNEPLSNNSDVIYELHRNGSGGTLIFQSPEVKVGNPATLAPTITSFTPTSGPAGATTVTITGANFSATAANNAVTFNGAAAVVKSASTTSLSVAVPATATTGTISVTVNGLTGSSSQVFTVSSTSGLSFGSYSPASGGVGTTVTITGTGFSTTAANDAVAFNGVPATIVGTPTATSIVVTVPTGASTGPLTVTVAGATVTGSPNFVVTTSGSSLPTPPATPPAMTPINDAGTHDPTVGTMAGQAGTDGGAAQYTAPIVVPPGRDGMQPALSLNYNSRSGDGAMGMGWTISGLSSIHRCPSTPEQDGVTLGVNYTNSDKLCLDGQRLVAVSGGYGQASTQYRTEVDSYARITQLSGDLGSSDTACFRVEQKDGRVLYYGGLSTPTSTSCTVSQVGSRVIPGGVTAPLSWLVEKIEDRVGNNETYTYGTYGSGEVLLTSIAYTGFTPTTTAGTRTVTFAYEPRTTAAPGSQDMSSSYLAGGLTLQTQALTSITTAVNGVVARTYTPSYTVSVYSQRLMMTSLTECAGPSGSQSCHAPTAFTYNDGSFDITQSALNASVIAIQGGDPTAYVDPTQIVSVPDLDGDGSRETVIATGSGTTEKVYIVQLGADRSVRNVLDVTGAVLATGGCGQSGQIPLNCGVRGTMFLYPSSYADFDGDGRAELLQTPASSTESQVLSLGVWNQPRGASLPANTPYPLNQYPTNIPFPFATGSTTAQGQIFIADMNGDGRPDVIVAKPDSTCGSDSRGANLGVFVYLNNLATGQLGTQVTTANFTIPASHLFCLQSTVQSSGSGTIGLYESIDHITDFNGDGLPDFVLNNTDVGLGNKTIPSRIVLTSNTGGTLGVTSAPCGSIGLVSDLKSDGTVGADDECNGNHATNNYFTTWMDVNGDGLEDFVIAKPGSTGTWQIHLNQGNGMLGGLIDTNKANGLATNSKGAYRYAGRFPTMDVDGDGKPDILIPSTVQGVHGFAMKMCSVQVAAPVGTEGCPSPTIGGSPQLVKTPQLTTQQCITYQCPEDPSAAAGTLWMPTNTEGADGTGSYPYAWSSENGDVIGVRAMYGANGTGFDNSIYHLAQLKFVQTAAATISVQINETPIISRQLSTAPEQSQAVDLNGNGLPGLLTTLGCSGQVQKVFTNGTTQNYNACRVVNDDVFGPSTLPDKVTPVANFANNPVIYSNDNLGVAPTGTSVQSYATAQLGGSCPLGPVLPGLMSSATNALGDSAQWGYDSLALGFLCTRDSQPEYSITGNNANLREYYFASSMPVVSAMLQSDGMGGISGSRSMAYNYNQAMYNHFGRGFQGFEAIASENLSPSDASRRLITTTHFNQDFPLTGKPTGTVTQTPQSSPLGAHTVHSETDSYECNLLINGTQYSQPTCPMGSTLFSALPVSLTSTGTVVFQPLLVSQSTADFDLVSGATSSTSATANTKWDVYGNLLNQTVTRADNDPVASKNFVSSHTVATANTYVPAVTSGNWSINLPLHSAVTSNIAYATGHPLPTNPSNAGAAATQQVTMDYTWNADRTPASKTMTAILSSGAVAQQSVTSYSYPATSYGLPSAVQVTDPNLTAQTLSPSRSTSYTYTNNGTSASADGYFVYTTTRYPNFPSLMAAQVTTTATQPGDGQPTSVTDVNGLIVATTYDPFGRPTQVNHYYANSTKAIEPPINMSMCNLSNSALRAGNQFASLTPCTSQLPGEDGNESTAIIRTTTAQLGYPTKVTWTDPLGRSVKQAEAGFSGTGASLNYSFIATLSVYDQNGTLFEQYTPYFVGGSTNYNTTFDYDALNRVITKIAPASEMDATHGDFRTDYQYAGRTTSITAHGTSVSCPFGANTSNLCVSMSRSTNVLGQLMQTIDAKSGQTNYWTEPQGHVIAMTDAEPAHNVTWALYNPLGQRTQSTDPDQGTWYFTYDAFSELLTQKDARAVVTTVLGRDALGRATAQQALPPPSPPSPPTTLDDESIYDTWSYDPTNCIGSVNVQSRYRGTAANPANNPLVWQEATTCDTAARPNGSTTVITEQGTTVTMGDATVYDLTYGYPLTHTYPSPTGAASGLTVKNTYTAYGQLDEISNNATSYVYWTAQAQNEWKHVTQESFPGVITGAHSDFHSSGQANSLAWSGTTSDNFTYTYDSFGNVTKQSRTGGGTNSETYAYDQLERLTSATRTSATVPVVSYSYSPSGNITSKSDWASSYTYGTGGTNCGPHFVTAASGSGTPSFTYQCDANGNVVGGNTLSAVFDVENRPKSVTRAAPSGSTYLGGTMGWSYGGGHMVMETDTAQGTTRYFGPGGYEQVGSGATAKQVHELGPVIVTRESNGLGSTTETISVVLTDRLGATMNVIENGTSTARAYDAFGKARNGGFDDRVNGTLNLADPILGGLNTIHGFTKHDHADGVALIHMGGRVYDPNLGRFLQVDPIIGNPASSQSLNPYSYIGNNPLSGTDPTGYQQCTGSNVEHESCESPTLSVTDMHSPSATEMKAAKAAAQAAQGNGATPGQSNNSVKTASVASGSQGNPTTDPTSKQDGNPANGDYNGGSDSQAQKLDTIKVTARAMSAPSRDLGFYLSQKYSPGRPYYHKYGGPGAGDWAVCHPSSSPWCTNERGYDALTRFVYPNQNPSNPVQNGDINTVYWPWPFDNVAVGDIRTFLEPTTFSVYNITLPNHDFYDGYVRRQVVTQGDTLYLRTSGEGNNTNEFRHTENVATWRPGFNMSNENFRQYMVQSWLKEQP